MSRPMSPEREKEFEQILAFLVFHFEILVKPKIPPGGEAPPSLRAEAERIARKHGRSKALVGARQALNDVIEDLCDLSAEGVNLMDQALRSAGIETLSEMRRRYSASYQRVLRCGTINSDTEYYLINGLVVDQGSALTPEEREHLQNMISAYEDQLG